MNKKPFVFHAAFDSEFTPESPLDIGETESTFRQSYLFVNAIFTAINFMALEIEERVLRSGGAAEAQIVTSCKYLAAIGLGFVEEMNIQFTEIQQIAEAKKGSENTNDPILNTGTRNKKEGENDA